MRNEEKKNVYIGHRYVPKLFGEWDKKKTYEGLSIVTYQGASYTSKKRVPVGIDILDEDYWVVTGNYDAQVEGYREEVRRVQSDMDSVTGDVDQLGHDFTRLETETNEKIEQVEQSTDQKISESETRTDQKLEDIEQSTDQKIGDTLEQAQNIVSDLEKDVKIKAPYHNISYDRLYSDLIKTDFYLTHIKRETPNGKLNLKYKKLTGQNTTVVENARQENYSVALNAGMFGGSNDQQDYSTIVDGQPVNEYDPSSPKNYRHYLAVMANGDLKSYPTGTSLDRMIQDGVVNATVGYIPIYENNQKMTSLMTSFDEFTEKHPRQIIAQVANGDYYILTIGGRGVDGQGATVSEAYDLLMANVSNVVFAYNLDGGGSNQTVVRGNMINPTYSGLSGNELRKRPDMLYIEEFESVGNRDENIQALAKDIAQIKDDLSFTKGVQEGTWTPVLGDEDNYEVDDVVYERNTGDYVRIGNIIIANYHVIVSDKGSGQGIIRMRGLPGANETTDYITSSIAQFSGLNSADHIIPFMEQRGAGTIQTKAVRSDELRTSEVVNILYNSVGDSFSIIGTHIFKTNADPKKQ